MYTHMHNNDKQTNTNNTNTNTNNAQMVNQQIRFQKTRSQDLTLNFSIPHSYDIGNRYSCQKLKHHYTQFA